MDNLLALPSGTMLAGDYRIERVLGAGGFGLTYLARDLTLDRPVAIKEYFPSDFAAREGTLAVRSRSTSHDEDYRWGLERFIEEAQALARFDHPNIARVHRYFRENNTGYMVLRFEDGRSFKTWFAELGRAPAQADLDAIVTPLLDALELIHAGNFLHRDIAPDNIIIRPDGSPVLIDFGSARGEVAQHSRTVSALVKPGYSPFEQYAATGRQQGPWTDIYALSATLYHAVAGKRPADSPTRMTTDELIPAAKAARGTYRPSFLAAIDRGLRLRVEERPQSVTAWRGELMGGKGRAASPAKAASAPAADLARTRKLEGALAPVVKLPRRKPAAKAVTPPSETPPAVLVAPAGGARALVARPRRALMSMLSDVRASVGAAVRSRTAAAPVAATPPAPAPAVEIAEDQTEIRRPQRIVARPVEIEIPVPVLKPFEVPRDLGLSKLPWGRLLLIVGIVVAMVAGRDLAPRLFGPYQPAAGVATTELGLVAVLRGHAAAVSALALSNDGRTLASADVEGAAKLWDPVSGTLLRTFAGPGTEITALDLDGEQLAMGRRDGSIDVYSVGTGTRLRSIREENGPVYAMMFAERAEGFVTAGQDHRVREFSARGNLRRTQSGHDGTVFAMAETPDGRYRVTGSADKTVRLWDTRRNRQLRTLRGHTDDIRAVAISADGRLIASGSNDGTAALWSADGGDLLHKLLGHTGRVLAIAISPDARLVATAGEDGTVKLWSTSSGAPVHTYVGHSATVRAIAFSTDGRRLLSASDDTTIRIWGSEIASLP